MTVTATEQFSPTARSTQVRTFAETVRQMRSDLTTMSSAERVAQAGFTSIEDSAIPAFDALGQARMLIGKQDDGTFGVVYIDGPPPPKPNRPIVAARQGGVYVAIDGTFEGGYTRPADLARFDIHMSATPGFVPDGTTIVGDVPEAGGRLLNAPNVTQYVKVVAVSRAKESATGGLIASAATDEIAVLPLPISQIAAGAIGTKELAADFIWSSRVVIGSTSGAAVELDGRDPLLPGLHAYDQYRERTFRLDATTGAVFIKGQLRTADTGERLVWRETTDHDIRFYPATGNKWASLFARTFTIGGADYGAFLLQSALYNNRRSFIWVTPETVDFYRGIDGGAKTWAGLQIGDTYVDLAVRSSAGGTPFSQMYIDNTAGFLKWGTGQVYFGGSNAEASFSRDSSRLITIQSSSLEIKHTSNINLYAGHQYFIQSANFGNVTLKSGLLFATTGVDVWNPFSGAPLYIGAVDLVKKSAREVKTEVERPAFDSVEVIRRAPISQYEYLADQRDERGRYRRADKHYGPMTNDVPDALVRRTADGTPGLGLSAEIAVVWDATARHADTLDDQSEAIAYLGGRVDDLTRRLAALEGP